MGDDNYSSTVTVVAQVPRIDGRLTSYAEFRDKFMRANLPVLITGLMQDWRASKDWVTDSGTPNLAFFSTHFGKSEVQVAECGKREFNDQKRFSMTVSEFIDYWQRLNANPQDRSSSSLLYLKDWHFVKEYSEYHAYRTPEFFVDDWLNFYLEHYQLHLAEDVKEESGDKGNGCCSDYRFVYLGPKGTWTPLHADVFRSYSWSGNVCGRKLWHLLPPSETHLIYDRHMRNTVYDIYGEISAKQFPNFHKATWLECIQDTGEILFVPSGWYHQVTNMEDAISINHNWFNGCDLHWVWQLLLDDYKETRASIEDIRSIADDFEDLCQRNLAANSGMNLHDFFTFITKMAGFFFSLLRKIMFILSNEEGKTVWICNEKSTLDSVVAEPSFRHQLSQVLFNLESIESVAEGMSSAELFKQEDSIQDETSDQGTEEHALRNAFGKEKMEGRLLECWERVTESNEFLAFLGEKSSPDGTHMNLGKPGNDMNACSGGVDRFYCNSLHDDNMNEQDRAPENIFIGCSQCVTTQHELDCSNCVFNRCGYEGFVKGSLHYILKDEVFVRVKTPKHLALVIRSVIDYYGNGLKKENHSSCRSGCCASPAEHTNARS